MERTRSNFKLPDAINNSIDNNFVQIPNDFIRNPEISAKAKTILCILLSNKEGWHSYTSVIQQMMKEGRDAIITGTQELKNLGYLIQVKYRDKFTKTWKGSFWSYTNKPHQFDFSKNITLLDHHGLECVFDPPPDYPDPANPVSGKQVPNNINNNNTNIFSSKQLSSNGFITPMLFEQFWERYPKKTDKGKALTAWNKLCSRKDRPTMVIIKQAIRLQKETKRWKEGFIPMPTTWLNQSRWLDDSKQMDAPFPKNNTTKFIKYDGIKYTLCDDGRYRSASGEVYID